MKILNDVLSSGRLASDATEENIDCVLHKLMDDIPLTIRQIALDISKSRERVQNMWHNEPGMTNLSSRLLSRHPTRNQKRARLITSWEDLILVEEAYLIT